MKKIIYITSILVSILFISCEITNFDLQDNPNELTPNALNPDFLLNEIQILFMEAMQDISINTDDVMRYENMSDTYTDIAEPAALNGEWEDMYALRENVRILEGIVEQDDNLLFHRGIAKILHAYGMATLVDYLGDIPFSEANAAANTFNPVADDDATIYAALLVDIDLAIQDINNASVTPSTDLYYNGDASKWIKLANTLKFRLLLNMGSTGDINTLISQDNLINSSNDDFQFNYSTALTPDSRHPYFERGYESTGASRYMGNNFMWMLKDSKTIRDPRLRYYIYRQTNTDPPLNFARCLGDPIFDFCYIGDFYWGRDHGDDSPTPNDDNLISTYGLYPAGGSFDADDAVLGLSGIHLGGAGIFPIILKSFVDFLKAEAILTLGADGDAAILLEDGIRSSMAKVLNFSEVDAAYAATATDVDDYVAYVMAEYAAATSTEEKLDIVEREYYLASYGNSIESYNAYRRTGYPSLLQTPIKNESTPFPRTFSLPSDAVSTNTSLNQRPITNKVFWDTKPDGFIN